MEEAPNGSLLGRMLSIWAVLTTKKYSRHLSLLMFLVLMAAVPLTVYVGQVTQDPRQRAAGTTTLRKPPLVPGTLLPAPKIASSTCGKSTKEVVALELTWQPVPGAKKYAIRIDEDPDSWGGDTRLLGDTVENGLTDTTFRRCAVAGRKYEWWIHAIDQFGRYSDASKLQRISCPTNVGPEAPGSLGIGTFIPIEKCE